MSRSKQRCFYCGHELLAAHLQRPRSKTRDHVYPKARGGGRGTVKACRLCNQAKGDLTMAEFRVKAVEGAMFYGEGGEEWET